jgi:YHS domain-containing protein
LAADINTTLAAICNHYRNTTNTTMHHITKNIVSHTTLQRIARGLVSGLAGIALAALMGCSAMQAQNPSGTLKPVNAHVVDGASPVMLKGHDVVAYFTDGKHAVGKAEFASLYEGVNFYFASAEHKALFDKAPAQYIPQYGGYCANGIVYGIPWGGDADTWIIQNGKLYIFGGRGSKDAFLVDVPANLALAEKYWAEEVKGSNSFWQRTKRLTFRVPHYKSGAELAALVAAQKGEVQ